MGGNNSKAELREGEEHLDLIHVPFLEGSHFESYKWGKVHELLHTFRPGDLIAVFRNPEVKHFTVCLTDGWVIHFYAKGRQGSKADTMAIFEYLVNSTILGNKVVILENFMCEKYFGSSNCLVVGTRLHASLAAESCGHEDNASTVFGVPII